MIRIDSITLEVPDVPAARAFYEQAFDIGPSLGLRAAEAPTHGFRGFTLSLIVSQPATVDGFLTTALAAGASELMPAKRSLWGYGGVLRAPDGAIWKVATSSKKNSGPATRTVDDFTVLLGVADVAATKRFYVDQGVEVARSFGRKFVQFDTGPAVTLALYNRSALAKQVGLDPEGSGSARMVIRADAGAFTDPDGFAWETATPAMVA